MVTTIDDVLAAATKEVTDSDSLIALVNTTKQMLDEALAKVGQLTPEQQAAIDGVFATLTANDQRVADALAANVPPAPVP